MAHLFKAGAMTDGPMTSLRLAFRIVAFVATMFAAPASTAPTTRIEQVAAASLACHQKARAERDKEHPCYMTTSTLTIERGKQCKATFVYHYTDHKDMQAVIFKPGEVKVTALQNPPTAIRIACDYDALSKQFSKVQRSKDIKWLECMEFVWVSPDGDLPVKTWTESQINFHFLEKDRAPIVELIGNLTKLCRK